MAGHAIAFCCGCLLKPASRPNAHEEPYIPGTLHTCELMRSSASGRPSSRRKAVLHVESLDLHHPRLEANLHEMGELHYKRVEEGASGVQDPASPLSVLRHHRTTAGKLPQRPSPHHGNSTTLIPPLPKLSPARHLAGSLELSTTCSEHSSPAPPSAAPRRPARSRPPAR